jgi:hypothetical protein
MYDASHDSLGFAGATTPVGGAGGHAATHFLYNEANKKTGTKFPLLHKLHTSSIYTSAEV